MDNKESFNYTYSAKQQAEIDSIRQKYLPREEDKMERLRKLDAGVTQKANAIAIIIGVAGALILGFGMSLFMTDFGDTLGLRKELEMLIGIAVGAVGIVLVSAAYPIYQRVIKKERERIAPEVIRLTDELSK